MELRSIPEHFELEGIHDLEVALQNPLWHIKEPWSSIFDTYSGDPPEGDSTEWKNLRQQYLWFLASMYEQNKIAFGNWDDGYNDDDRVLPITTAVIHHTSTWDDTPISYLEALGIWRLYYPLFRTGAWQSDKPITSGHFRDGIQTFVGYHWLVFCDGSSIRLLSDSYTGFHAGDLTTNKGSIGIAYVGDLSETTPSDDSLKEIHRILSIYPNLNSVLGHNEVMHKGKLVDTKCPGPWWKNLSLQFNSY